MKIKGDWFLPGKKIQWADFVPVLKKKLNRDFSFQDYKKI